MLVLSRRVNETIVLPGLDITIRVVAVRAGVVRLGIEAPPDVTIVREELRRREAPCARRRDGPAGQDLPEPTVVVFHRS